jgi:hypothetical protein
MHWISRLLHCNNHRNEWFPSSYSNCDLHSPRFHDLHKSDQRHRERRCYWNIDHHHNCSGWFQCSRQLSLEH